MEKEQVSQPERQRKITEYAQMQHGGTPKTMGDVGNKEPRLAGEEEGIVGVAAKSVEKNAPSQETTSSL